MDIRAHYWKVGPGALETVQYQCLRVCLRVSFCLCVCLCVNTPRLTDAHLCSHVITPTPFALAQVCDKKSESHFSRGSEAVIRQLTSLTRPGRHGHTRRSPDVCRSAQTGTQPGSYCRRDGSNSCPRSGRNDDCHQQQERSTQQHHSSSAEHHDGCSKCSDTLKQ